MQISMVALNRMVILSQKKKYCSSWDSEITARNKAEIVLCKLPAPGSLEIKKKEKEKKAVKVLWLVKGESILSVTGDEEGCY